MERLWSGNPPQAYTCTLRMPPEKSFADTKADLDGYHKAPVRSSGPIQSRWIHWMDQAGTRAFRLYGGWADRWLFFLVA